MARSVSMEPCERRLAGRDPMFMRPSSFTGRREGVKWKHGSYGTKVSGRQHASASQLSRHGANIIRSSLKPTWRELLEELHKAGVLTHNLRAGSRGALTLLPALRTNNHLTERSPQRTLRYASHDTRAISAIVSRHSCGGCLVGASVASSTADV